MSQLKSKNINSWQLISVFKQLGNTSWSHFVLVIKSVLQYTQLKQSTNYGLQ